MESTIDLNTKKLWRRFGTALAIVFALHLIFFLFVAPYLDLQSERPSRTEVVQISPQQLADLKRRVMANKDKYLPPLLKQELKEQYKTKEAPPDAKMMGAFNQTVPKEMVAGPQADAPQEGGGAGGKGAQAKRTQPREKLNLSKLGLGTKVPKPIPQPQQNEANDQRAGPAGPPGLYRPVGRDDKDLEHGNENMLNAVESKFYSFFTRLEEPLIRNWFFLLRSHDGQIRSEMNSRGIRAGSEIPITIEFTLDRSGNFRSIDVIESSGVKTLDWATRESVRKLGALPNPPPDLFEGGQYYTRRVRFMVHVTDAPVINSRPDLAW